MIHTFSTTIRRKEMDAVLTCMVDERIGPGELNSRFVQTVKEFFGCDGAVALRSPASAVKYALRAIGLDSGEAVMISALAPAWHYQVLEDLGYKPIVLDVEDSTGLVTAEIVSKGLEEGGRVLILHETNGILPEIDEILALGIPVIEDVSKSAGSWFPTFDENRNPVEARKAGSVGVYTILGLEEKDVITAGGGAILMAPGRKEWYVLKNLTENIPMTELLPDINCALGWVQLKEFKHNELSRKRVFALFQRACMAGKHRMFIRGSGSVLPVSKKSVQQTEGTEPEETFDYSSTMSSFPLVLSSSFKDVKQYASKKDIEINLAYEDSVIALKEEELSAKCIKAKSLFLRCALFPLYPRLSHSQVAKIVKVLGTLP